MLTRELGIWAQLGVENRKGIELIQIVYLHYMSLFCLRPEYFGLIYPVGRIVYRSEPAFPLWVCIASGAAKNHPCPSAHEVLGRASAPNLRPTQKNQPWKGQRLASIPAGYK